MAENGAGLNGLAGFAIVILVVMRQGRQPAIMIGDGGVAQWLHDITERFAHFLHVLAGGTRSLCLFLQFGHLLRMILHVGLAFFRRHFGQEFRQLGAFRTLGQLDRIRGTILGVHAIGECRHAVVVHLGPFIERMVMALGADDAGAQKDLNGVGQMIELVFIPLIETDAAAVPGTAFGGEQLFDELIVWCVGLQFLLHPLLVSLGRDLALGVIGQAQNISPIVEQMTRVAIAAEKCVDEFPALLRVI